MVDDELCAPAVVDVVPHIAALELAPLDVFEVETPDYGHGYGWAICNRGFEEGWFMESKVTVCRRSRIAGVLLRDGYQMECENAAMLRMSALIVCKFCLGKN